MQHGHALGFGRHGNPNEPFMLNFQLLWPSITFWALYEAPQSYA